MSDGLKTEINIPGADLLVNRTTGLAGMPTKTPDYSQFQIGGAKADIPGNQMVVEPVIVSQDVSPVVKDLDSSTADFGNGPEEQAWRKEALEGPNLNANPNNPEDEARRRQETEYAARNQRDEIFDNIIRNSDNPGEILYGVRQIMEMAKDANTTEAMDDSYGVRSLSKYLYQKRLAMKMDPYELQRRGWIKDYNAQTGEATTLDRRAGGFAIKMEERTGPMILAEVIVDEKGKESKVFRPGTEYVFKYGTPVERKNMEVGLEQIYIEIAVDTTNGAYLGAQRAYRDDLTNLTAVEYSRLPHYSHDMLVYMLNRADEASLNDKSGVIESKKKGQDEVAMWWYLGMMACETRAGLEDFLDCPATDALIMPGAPKAERIHFLKQQFGDWTTWTDKGRTPKTLEEEVRAGKRGPVSMYGNIPARGRGEKFDFDYNKEMRYIQETIGRMAGTSVDSSWYAATILRVWDEFSINGVVNFPDATEIKDRVRLSLGADIFLQGNDMGKANPEYSFKEFTSGRVFGPEGLVGKVPRWANPYLDHAQIRVGYDKAGNPVTLPLRRAWLGDKARKVLDRATGQMVDIPAVPYTPLGKVDVGTLPRGDFEAFTQMHALAAREGWVFDMATNNEPDAKQLLEKGLRTMRKRASIIYNWLIALKGDARGQSNPSKVATETAQGFMDDALTAYEDTISYITSVESSNIEVFDPDRADLGFKNTVSLTELSQKISEYLGMRRGSIFNPERQFFNDRRLIRKIPRKGTAHGLAGGAVSLFNKLFGGGR